MPSYAAANNVDAVPLHVAYSLWGEREPLGSMGYAGCDGIAEDLTLPWDAEGIFARIGATSWEPGWKAESQLSSNLWLPVLSQRYQGSCFKHLKGLPIF